MVISAWDLMLRYLDKELFLPGILRPQAEITLYLRKKTRSQSEIYPST
jgi:hypothetical protein